MQPGDESVSFSQVNGVRCKSKCFDEEYVKPVDIEGIKLDLALLESQMNSGLAGHFDGIITMQSKQNDLENNIKIQEVEMINLKQENLIFQLKLLSLEQTLSSMSSILQAIKFSSKGQFCPLKGDHCFHNPKTTIEVPNDACYSNNEALVNTIKDALEVSNDADLSNSDTLTNLEVPNDACLLNNEAVANTVNDTLELSNDAYLENSDALSKVESAHDSIIAHLMLPRPYSTTRVILFDYQKAFDLIDYRILVNKLLQIDLPRSIINWIIDFLSDRFQRVKLS